MNYSMMKWVEDRVREKGVTPAGVGWPSGADLEARFALQLSMVEKVQDRRPSVLDLGCGPGLLVDYLAATNRLDSFDYLGIDISDDLLALARERWPSYEFVNRDIMATPLGDGSFDVVVMNGVLTARFEMPREEMKEFSKAIIKAAFKASRVGIAFNVMSKHVDWERDDLFHWEFDDIASFLRSEVTKHYDFHASYGLFEYTVFLWHEAQRPAPLGVEWWNRGGSQNGR